MFSSHPGLDRHAREDLLPGLSLNRNGGEINHRIGGGESGEAEASPASLHPCAFRGDSGIGAWLHPGCAREDATRVPDGGARRTQPAGIDHRTGLELKSGAIHMRPDADNLAPAVSMETWRLRANLDGGSSKALSAAGDRLPDSARIGARLGGDDLKSGGGLEIGGDVDHAHPGPGIGLEAKGRFPLAHREDGFENRGVGLVARFGPGEPRRGLRLSVVPERGETPDRTGDLRDGSGLLDSVADGGVADEDGTGDAGSGMRPDAPTSHGVDVVGRRDLPTPARRAGLGRVEHPPVPRGAHGAHVAGRPRDRALPARGAGARN